MPDRVAPARESDVDRVAVRPLRSAADGRLDDEAPAAAALLIFDPVAEQEGAAYTVAHRPRVEVLAAEFSSVVVRVS